MLLCSSRTSSSRSKPSGNRRSFDHACSKWKRLGSRSSSSDPPLSSPDFARSPALASALRRPGSVFISSNFRRNLAEAWLKNSSSLGLSVVAPISWPGTATPLAATSGWTPRNRRLAVTSTRDFCAPPESRRARGTVETCPCRWSMALPCMLRRKAAHLSVCRCISRRSWSLGKVSLSGVKRMGKTVLCSLRRMSCLLRR
mmetsp:Transcript_27785/g.70281  ORF Transcript_27785/g.70281 Transcript_27785/m.70281 type:complete len:200 (+) Transcript_27785:350-949(+)